MDNTTNIHETNTDEEIIDNPDIPFVRGNPFLDKLKNGYSITVHYGPQDNPEPITYDEMIEDEVQRIRFLLYEKTKDIPQGQKLSDRLQELYQAIKNC